MGGLNTRLKLEAGTVVTGDEWELLRLKWSCGTEVLLAVESTSEIGGQTVGDTAVWIWRR